MFFLNRGKNQKKKKKILVRISLNAKSMRILNVVNGKKLTEIDIEIWM